MKKMVLGALILILCTTMLTACGDPVEKDLLSYVNDHITVMSKEVTQIETDFNNIMSNSKDDSVIANKLKTSIIPRSNKMLSEAKAIKPTTDEVKKANEQLISYLTEENEAYKLTLTACNTQNVKLLDTIQNKITDANKKAADFTKTVKNLEKQHNVEEEKDKKTK